VNAERVVIKMNDVTTAGIFEIEGDASLIHLVMPVRV
jgi:DNA polymerase III sliding clamp (beta) subunit (PCNA family)